ncbi:MAG: [FeFe] hydrogenase H-cluster radical SAM maturase HydE [Phycisphaerae bacterium]
MLSSLPILNHCSSSPEGATPAGPAHVSAGSVAPGPRTNPVPPGLHANSVAAGLRTGRSASAADGASHLESPLTETDLLHWLREEDDSRLETLYAAADRVRHEMVGDAVHLRGLVEISNHCVRQCAYCGLRAGHTKLVRYRLSADEVLACARQAVEFGYGTVVMQAGEDYGIGRSWLARLIRQIKAETPLAVTLSLGERPVEDLAAWREAGADRYLLRFETSDRELYARIHPPLGSRPSDRVELLRTLRGLGYEIGSGVMVGIPGQTYETLARDLLLFRELDLDMIGVGPYIPHPDTPLGERLATRPEPHPSADQVPNTEKMAYKMVALTRLMCPQANIPGTTAIATLNQESGRELALCRGANVVMPNLTPVQYRAMYEIYPAKACITETAQHCRGCLKSRIRSLGRTIGTGPGGRRRLA